MAPKPPIRICPVCGVAMLARKSREDGDRYDIFSCLGCGAEIVETPRHPGPGEGGDRQP
jgi:ssDNA-binding Zn-finger/Zn-ribbon topoisomerase 1